MGAGKEVTRFLVVQAQSGVTNEERTISIS